MAFSLAKLNRTREASVELDRIAVEDLNASDHAVFLATSGLVAIRSGMVETGQELYERAIATAPEPATRVRAQLMLVVELLRLQVPGLDDVLDTLRDNVRANLKPQDQSWLEHLED